MHAASHVTTFFAFRGTGHCQLHGTSLTAAFPVRSSVGMQMTTIERFVTEHNQHECCLSCTNEYLCTLRCPCLSVCLGHQGCLGASRLTSWQVNLDCRALPHRTAHPDHPPVPHHNALYD